MKFFNWLTFIVAILVGVIGGVAYIIDGAKNDESAVSEYVIGAFHLVVSAITLIAACGLNNGATAEFLLRVFGGDKQYVITPLSDSARIILFFTSWCCIIGTAYLDWRTLTDYSDKSFALGILAACTLVCAGMFCVSACTTNYTAADEQTVNVEEQAVVVEKIVEVEKSVEKQSNTAVFLFIFLTALVVVGGGVTLLWLNVRRSEANLKYLEYTPKRDIDDLAEKYSTLK